jgi:hypothetical protein
MKNKVLIKKIRLPIYNTSFWIVVSKSLHKAVDTVEDLIDNQIINPEDKKSIRAYMYAYTDPEGKPKVMVFLKPTAKPGEIAHEVNHAMNVVFCWAGMRISTSNDEHQCYYLEYMVDKVHKTLESFKKLT